MWPRSISGSPYSSRVSCDSSGIRWSRNHLSPCALDPHGVLAVDVDRGDQRLAPVEVVLHAEVRVPQLERAAGVLIARMGEPRLERGGIPRPGCIEVPSEEAGIVARTLAEELGRVDAVGGDFGRRLLLRDGGPRGEDRSFARDQASERPDAHGAVGHAVLARVVEPDDRAVLDADQRRARVPAEARAVVRQRLPAAERLHHEAGREPLHLVQVAEVPCLVVRVVARVVRRVADQRDELVGLRLDAGERQRRGQAVADDAQQRHVGRCVVGQVGDRDDLDRPRVARVRPDLLQEVDLGAVAQAAGGRAQEHAAPVEPALGDDLGDVPVRRDDARRVVLLVDHPAGAAPCHGVVDELDAADREDAPLGPLDEGVRARREVGKLLELDRVVAHDERRPTHPADDGLEGVELHGVLELAASVQFVERPR